MLRCKQREKGTLAEEFEHEIEKLCERLKHTQDEKRSATKEKNV
jgi:hypothetical protein